MSADPFICSVADLSFAPHGAVHPSPADWRDVVIYELMIDRFDDGRDRPMYDPASPPESKTHPPEAYLHFHGGNLRGVTRRLDYIQGLGINAVWITPPFKQCSFSDDSYHGYAIQDFLRIDPRFGTTDDLRDLVAAAHARGMYVLLDVVFDHAGDVFGYAGREGRQWSKGQRFDVGFWRGSDGKPVGDEIGPDDAVWPIELQSPDAFFRMGSTLEAGAAREAEATRGDFHSSKALDMTNPAVVSAMIDVYKYWIAVTDVDGFRMDTFRHIEPEAGRRFCSAIREYAMSIGKRNFLLLGEVVADDPTVARFAGSNSPDCHEQDKTCRAMLDAVFDFPLHHSLGPTLRGKQSPEAIRNHWKFLNNYFRDPAEAGRHYVRFAENHDFGAGDSSRLLHGDSDPRLAVMAAAFVLMSQGIPCLYYGAEQGFDGGGKDDRFVREGMFGGDLGAFGTKGVHFFNPQHPIYKAISRLAEIRRNEAVLRCGRQLFCKTSTDGTTFTHPGTVDCTLAFTRVLDRREVLVVMNLSRMPRNDWIELDAKYWPAGRPVVEQFGNLGMFKVEPAHDTATKVRIGLPARGVAVLLP